MDLLKYGMENRKSSSAIKRKLAEAALNVEKMRADLEENAIEKSDVRIPEDDGEKLLDEIHARIEAEKKAGKNS